MNQNRRAPVNVRTGRRLRGFLKAMNDSPSQLAPASPAAQCVAHCDCSLQVGAGPSVSGHRRGRAADCFTRTLATCWPSWPTFCASTPSRASSTSSSTRLDCSTTGCSCASAKLGFIYAVLDLTEGIGLYLEKTWAEYLTLIITASFLPWEILEIFRRVTVIRVGLLVVNAAGFLLSI